MSSSYVAIQSRTVSSAKLSGASSSKSDSKIRNVSP